jgi:hypothetical protein
VIDFACEHDKRIVSQAEHGTRANCGSRAADRGGLSAMPASARCEGTTFGERQERRSCRSWLGHEDPQEIAGASSRLAASELLFLLSRFQDLEGAEEALVDAHHGTGIVKLSTIVGSTEQSDQLALGEELVSILNDLMGTANEVHVVLLEEPRNDVGSKGERDTTIVLAPSSYILVRVGPKEIAKKTAVGDISRTHHPADLLHRVKVGAETAVHCEDLLVNDGSNGKAVEAVRKCLPKLDVVSTLALVVEAVDTVDGSTLVVSAENEEVFRVLDLVGEEEADGLERLLASVDVVAEEEVVGLGGEAAVLKQA